MQGCLSHSLILCFLSCVRVAMHFRTINLLNLYAAQVVIHADILRAIHTYWHLLWYSPRSV
jgi:hypothetical protein